MVPMLTMVARIVPARGGACQPEVSGEPSDGVLKGVL